MIVCDSKGLVNDFLGLFPSFRKKTRKKDEPCRLIGHIQNNGDNLLFGGVFSSYNLLMWIFAHAIGTAPAGFPEWLKILFTALAAFTAGLIAEPIKLIIGYWYKRRNLRRSLYSELAHNYGHLSMFLRERARPIDDFYLFCETEGFPTDVYRWAKSQLDVFYQLDEAGALDNIYRNMEWAFSNDEDETVEIAIEQKALLAMTIFENHICSGNLRLGLFKRVNRNAYDLFKKVKDSKIERAEMLLDTLQSQETKPVAQDDTESQPS